MERFGAMIRRLRTEKGYPLRTVAAFLDIDQAILSKIERGHRKVRRDLVIQLAFFFKVDHDELLVAWLSDNLLDQLKEEPNAMNALQMAEKKLNLKDEIRIQE
jgi:transcriptional regulator with XRE-family HTH domain